MDKLEIRRSLIEGEGVFALLPIVRGEVIHRLDDSRVVDDAHPLRQDLSEDPRHRDWLPDGTTVLMQSPAGIGELVVDNGQHPVEERVGAAVLEGGDRAECCEVSLLQDVFRFAAGSELWIHACFEMCPQDRAVLREQL